MKEYISIEIYGHSRMYLIFAWTICIVSCPISEKQPWRPMGPL